MANDDPRVRREQTRLGRIINRVDNALVVAGAALTFSRRQIRAAKESNRAEPAIQSATQPMVDPDQHHGPGRTETGFHYIENWETYDRQQALSLLRTAHDTLQASERAPNDPDLREGARIVQHTISQDTKAMEILGRLPIGTAKDGIIVDFDGSLDKPVYLGSEDLASVLRREGAPVEQPERRGAAIPDARREAAEARRIYAQQERRSRGEDTGKPRPSRTAEMER